ncbi:MAG: hypothetical protein ACC652_11225 [Acidimicrobiales bacterium]
MCPILWANSVMATESTTDQGQTLNKYEEARVAEWASLLASSSLETLRCLCARVAEDEATFARLASVVQALTVRRPRLVEGENVLARAGRLDGRGETDAVLDLVYDSFDELFRDDQMEAADGLIL